jgi:hypothetical protein
MKGGWKVTWDGERVQAIAHSKMRLTQPARGENVRGQLIIHGRDGKIRTKDSWIVPYRVIHESVGTPSVSRERIAAAGAKF